MDYKVRAAQGGEERAQYVPMMNQYLEQYWNNCFHFYQAMRI